MFELFGAEIEDHLKRNKGPLMVMIVGPNGAGKSTCYRKFLAPALRETIEYHIDPDAIEREIRADLAGEDISDQEFSEMARNEANFQRNSHLKNRRSFSFETVFSDPVGDKLSFIAQAIEAGYTVVLLAIGLDSPAKSRERVALRVERHGHDVPPDRIQERYDRVLMNIVRGTRIASVALVVDNSTDNLEDDGSAYEPLLLFREGEQIKAASQMPQWWERAQMLSAVQERNSIGVTYCYPSVVLLSDSSQNTDEPTGQAGHTLH